MALVREKPPEYLKDPNATLDYLYDWGSEWLGSDTIASSSWVLPEDADNLTIIESQNSLLTATVWVAGGLAGKKYRLTNRIQTAAGRIDDRSIVLSVKER